MIDLQHTLEQVLKITKEAGDTVLGYYGKDLDAKDKGNNSPVTKADLRSDEILKAALSRFAFGLLSEEGVDDKSRLKKKYVWVIDPLDGTKDFINQTGDFTIMVALVKRESKSQYRPVLGVIFRPVTNTFYFAVKDCGAYMMEDGDKIKQIRVSLETEPENLLFLTSRSHTTDIEWSITKKLRITKVGTIGSSLKACKVATGEGHINFNPSNKTWEWDVCASDIIVHEAGGKLTDTKGNVITYNKKDPRNQNGYLVTNGRLHNLILGELDK